MVLPFSESNIQLSFLWPCDMTNQEKQHNHDAPTFIAYNYLKVSYMVVTKQSDGSILDIIY